MTKPIRFGVQTAPQNCTWANLAAAWQLVDETGYDTAFTFDHFFAILSDPAGPVFEGWTTLAALAARSAHVKAGVLVTGNTYRHPMVLAGMGKTIDHLTGGRLIMGLGAGWFELEHTAHGIPFYSTAERIRRLGETAAIIKRLWTEDKVSFDGKYYKLTDAYCEPKPVQRPHPPIMIGGGGEKLTLKIVAQYADIWNTFGSPEEFRHKISILREHCRTVGRDMEQIEICWAGATFVTSSSREKEQIVERFSKAFGRAPAEVEAGLLVGTVEEMRDKISRYIEEGVTHFILMPVRLDGATIKRFAEEVIPKFRA